MDIYKSRVMMVVIVLRFITMYLQLADAVDFRQYLCRYQYHSTAMTWSSARDVCESTNRTLLRLDSTEEMANISSVLIPHIKLLKPQSLTISATLWNGLHQEINPVRLLWDDCKVYTANPNQWSIAAGNSEGCVVFNTTDNSLSIQDCSVLHPFICENRTEDITDCYTALPVDSLVIPPIGADGADDTVPLPCDNCAALCYNYQNCAGYQFVDNGDGVRCTCKRHYYDRSGLANERPPDFIYIKNIFVYNEPLPSNPPVISNYYCPEVSSSIQPSSTMATSSVFTPSMVYSSDSSVTVVLSSSSSGVSGSVFTPPMVYSSDSVAASSSGVSSSLFTPPMVYSSDSVAASSSGVSGTVFTTSLIYSSYSLLNVLSSTQNTTSVIPVASSSHSVVTSSYVISGTTTSECYCPCSLSISSTTITNAQLQAKIEQIQNELSVNKKETSSYKRKLNSAPDDRVSAQSIGYVGVVILTVSVGLLVCIDLPTLLRDTKRLLLRFCSLCKRK